MNDEDKLMTRAFYWSLRRREMMDSLERLDALLAKEERDPTAMRPLKAWRAVEGQGDDLEG